MLQSRYVFDHVELPETAAYTFLYGKAHRQTRDLYSQRQVERLSRHPVCKDQALQQRMGRGGIGAGGIGAGGGVGQAM